MFDVMGELGVVLMEETVLAAIPRTGTDPRSCGRIHQFVLFASR